MLPPKRLRLCARRHDDIICLETPEPFYGISLHYADFHQVTDEEVIRILEAQNCSGRGGSADSLRVVRNDSAVHPFDLLTIAAERGRKDFPRLIRRDEGCGNRFPRLLHPSKQEPKAGSETAIFQLRKRGLVRCAPNIFFAASPTNRTLHSALPRRSKINSARQGPELCHVNIGEARVDAFASPDTPMVQSHLKRMFARSRCVNSGKQALQRSWQQRKSCHLILLRRVTSKELIRDQSVLLVNCIITPRQRNAATSCPFLADDLHAKARTFAIERGLKPIGIGMSRSLQSELPGLIGHEGQLRKSTAPFTSSQIHEGKIAAILLIAGDALVVGNEIAAAIEDQPLPVDLEGARMVRGMAVEKIAGACIDESMSESTRCASGTS